MKWAYYNDADKQICAWVKELIKAGVITDGEVDCRPIQQVSAEDVRGFRRAHFFCGIAVWDYALRLAGWPDDRPVWTGSCPCPSFSAAGKGKGFNDPRHLWPDWARLICECRPATIFGEQVNAAIGYGWLDLVQDDLEAQDYAVGKAVFGACSVGAFHIPVPVESVFQFVAPRATEELGLSGFESINETKIEIIEEAMNCFPLARRVPARVGLLRGAGNALCAPQATTFIRAYLDTI